MSVLSDQYAGKVVWFYGVAAPEGDRNCRPAYAVVCRIGSDQAYLKVRGPDGRMYSHIPTLFGAAHDC